MLTMVIANPIQFTMVSDVPLDSCGAFCATKVENNGESVITAIPQVNKKAIRTVAELFKSANGDIKQQVHDINKAIVAVFLAPKY